jgi:antitoxin ParD1/3/4
MLSRTGWVKQDSILLGIGWRAMRTTQQFSITLPNGMADQLRAKVAAGDYASESEVIREGLRALQARERALEAWLTGQVASTFDAVAAAPSRARSSSGVKAALATHHERASKAR